MARRRKRRSPRPRGSKSSPLFESATASASQYDTLDYLSFSMTARVSSVSIPYFLLLQVALSDERNLMTKIMTQGLSASSNLVSLVVLRWRYFSILRGPFQYVFHSAWRMCSGSVTWSKHPRFYHALLNGFICLFFFTFEGRWTRLGRLGWTHTRFCWTVSSAGFAGVDRFFPVARFAR